MRVLITVALAAMALAGCTTPAAEYTLTANGVPADVVAGEAFTFSMHADGAPAEATDHLGAHYWHAQHEDPTAALGDAAACDHTEGDLPGSWDVTCTIMRPGTHYLRGHARVTEDHDGMHHHEHWSAEHMVRVHPTEDQFQLSTSGAPANATAGEAFTFDLDITGGPMVGSDHIGAHYWAADADTGDIADAGACEHQEGEMPGRFTVTCALEAGDHVVRGHMRLMVGEQKHDFWAEAFTVSVA